MLNSFKINNSKKVIEKYSVDASIFKISPKGVFVPRSKDELISFVKEIINIKAKDNQTDISITSRAAGTCMSGGSLTSQYIISFTENLNRISLVNKESKFVEVEPGAFYRDIEKETLRYNLILPSYPASRELCAIGGMVGNNSGGEKTFKYGKTSKYIEEIEMICADGSIYNFKDLKGEELDNVLLNDKSFYGDIHRQVLKIIQDNQDVIESNKPKVTKNSSGYYLWDVYKPANGDQPHSMNLAKLICGSQGTLGVMTKFKLGLVEANKKSKMAVIFLKDIKDLPSIVEKVSPLMPESFEIFDDHTFKIAMKFLPQLVKNLKGSIFGLVKLFWPEFKMILTGSIPKIVMLIEFVEKSDVELDGKVNEIRNMFNTFSSDENMRSGVSTHVVETDEEAQKYWVFRRESFNLLRSKLKNVRTVPFVEDVVVKSSDLSKFLPEFEAILDREEMVYTIAGHAGDGNIHVIPLMTLKEESSIDQIERVSKDVYSLIQKYQGSLSGEHNDGLIRAPFLSYMYTEEMLSLFKEIKKAFDPLNIFNPNKKIDITWDYAKSSIDRSK